MDNKELTKDYYQYQADKEKLIKSITLQFAELFYKYDADYIVNVDWFCIELKSALFNEVGPFRLKGGD